MKTRLETSPAAPALPQEIILEIISYIVHSPPSSSSPSSTSTSTSTSAHSHPKPKAESNPKPQQPKKHYLTPLSDQEALLLRTQSTLHATSLLSHTWYHASAPSLYASPVVTARNFDAFVATICPSVNAHVLRSPPAELVRELDLGRLVHSGSRSLTARLLGRVKGGVRGFRAPMASFGISSLAALSKCKELRTLDLSLISEALSLPALFRAMSHLENLKTFYFPRTSFIDKSNENRDGRRAEDTVWPPRLEELYISGTLRDEAVVYFKGLPDTLRTLSLQNCQNLTGQFLRPILEHRGPGLTKLHLGYGMPGLQSHYFDDVFQLAPSLRELTILFEFISFSFFWPYHNTTTSVPVFSECRPYVLERLVMGSRWAHPKSWRVMEYSNYEWDREAPWKDFLESLTGGRICAGVKEVMWLEETGALTWIATRWPGGRKTWKDGPSRDEDGDVNDDDDNEDDNDDDAVNYDLSGDDNDGGSIGTSSFLKGGLREDRGEQ
ncbi:hypothetical protein MMC25_003215 [Agyrium rufum]|nr:hypothetical protein [Agyrium rufum]